MKPRPQRQGDIQPRGQGKIEHETYSGQGRMSYILTRAGLTKSQGPRSHLTSEFGQLNGRKEATWSGSEWFTALWDVESANRRGEFEPSFKSAAQWPQRIIKHQLTKSQIIPTHGKFKARPHLGVRLSLLTFICPVDCRSNGDPLKAKLKITHCALSMLFRTWTGPSRKTVGC